RRRTRVVPSAAVARVPFEAGWRVFGRRAWETDARGCAIRTELARGERPLMLRGRAPGLGQAPPSERLWRMPPGPDIALRISCAVFPLLQAAVVSRTSSLY